MRNDSFADETAPDTERYTPDGKPAAEQRIAADQRLIGDAVAALVGDQHFRALVMIGGYARGEGGIAWQQGQPAPYNDYDYFVVVQGLKRSKLSQLQSRLAALAEQLEDQVGVEVDLAILRRESLPTIPPSLMFAEMLWGHRVVAGAPGVLRDMPDMPISDLPLGEYTRLMLNRGALLLLNQQAIIQQPSQREQDRDRFIKYLFKATLACGDARLAAAGTYHPLYRVKWQRLQQLPDVPNELLQQYEQALTAKFYPDSKQFANIDLIPWQQHTINLWCESLHILESQRLGKPVVTWQQYASATIDKGQGDKSVVSTLFNLAVTLRDYGAMELLANPQWSLLYPRARLISILPSLLLATPRCDDRAMQRTLGCKAMRSGRSPQECFIEQWHRYA